MRDWKLRWVIGYTVFAAGLFVLLMFAEYENPVLPGDVPITRAVQALRSPWLDQLMILVGLPGSPPQTLLLNPLVVLIVFLCRLKPEALTLAIFIPTFGTISTWIRCGIDRARPSADLVFVFDMIKDRGCSFPSGHTANFIVILGFLMYVGLTRLKPSWHRNLLLGLYGLYIVLMGVSRFYIGDHWPSDVLGGVLLGSIFLVWMIVFYEWLQVRFFHAVSTPQRSASP